MASDKLGRWLLQYEEYLDGKRFYEDLPRSFGEPYRRGSLVAPGGGLGGAGGGDHGGAGGSAGSWIHVPVGDSIAPPTLAVSRAVVHAINEATSDEVELHPLPVAVWRTIPRWRRAKARVWAWAKLMWVGV